MVHRTTDLFFVLKFKHRVFCGRFTRESHDTSHATPATLTREPTHPRVSACSKNIKIVSYHRVRGCRAYGLLPLWFLILPNVLHFYLPCFLTNCLQNARNAVYFFKISWGRIPPHPPTFSRRRRSCAHPTPMQNPGYRPFPLYSNTPSWSS